MKLSWPITFIIVTAVISLHGCASTNVSNAAESANQSAIEAGSPYRWEYRRSGDFDVLTKTLIGVEAATTADPELAEFTRNQISSIQNDRATISPDQEPDQVRLVDAEDGHAKEVWVYKIEKATLAFVVSYESSPGGGTDVNITGPW